MDILGVWCHSNNPETSWPITNKGGVSSTDPFRPGRIESAFGSGEANHGSPETTHSPSQATDQPEQEVVYRSIGIGLHEWSKEIGAPHQGNTTSRYLFTALCASQTFLCTCFGLL